MRRIGNDPERLMRMEEYGVHGDIAGLIYDARNEAGLTQKQLAEKISTKQSVIARLEDADYEGHSLSMLVRIAYALDSKIQIAMVPDLHKLAKRTKKNRRK